MAVISVSPGNSISSLVNANPAGTEFYLATGIYRGQKINPKNDMRFYSDGGAVLNGSIILTGWVQSGGLWRKTGLPPPAELAGQGPDFDPLPTYCEDLFRNDVFLRRVATEAEVVPGKWWFDTVNYSATIADDPTGALMEYSQGDYAFYGAASNVTIENLTVEKYSTPAQRGGIHGANGLNWKVLNCHVRHCHGNGIMLGIGMLVQGGSTSDNGNVGIGCYETNGAIIDGVEAARNNYAEFDDAWNAGGFKITKSVGMVVRNCYVHHNYGTGVWSDIDMMNTTYTGNTVSWNRKHGINHEICHNAVISRNTLIGNGTPVAGLSTSERAQIRLSNGGPCIITENHVETDATSANGILMLNQDRSDGIYGPRITAGNRVYNNRIIIHDAAEGFNGVHNRSTTILDDYALDNLWDYNTYETNTPSLLRWYFALAWRDLNYVQNTWGQEQHATILTNNDPITVVTGFIEPPLTNSIIPAAADAMLAAIGGLLNGGTVVVYNGTPPATAASNLISSTVLAEIPLANPAFGSGTSDSEDPKDRMISALSLPRTDYQANASGTATFFRAYTSAGVAVANVVMQGECGGSGSGAHLELASTTVTAGGRVEVISLKISFPTQ